MDAQEGTEQIKVVKMLFEKALKMVMDSKITHGATAVALLKIARIRESKSHT